MNGIIYCAYNKINGKRYIGQTIQKLEERKRKHLTTNGCPYFHHALIKYGENSFEWKIIDTGENKEELDMKEKFWISFFNSNNSKNGYNLTDGGQTNSHMLSEDIMKARNNFVEKYGKEYDIKRKMKNIRCIETQEVFKTAADAGRSKGIHKGHITSAANGDLKSSGGYHWEWCLELSFFPNALYCKELNKIFLSFYEAQRENNFSSVYLSKRFKIVKKLLLTQAILLKK